MRTLTLTRGYLAQVDDSNWEYLSQFNWGVLCNPGNKCYAVGWVDGRQILLHREIMKAPTGSHIDHINGDGLDNQRHNLRFATRAQNSRNRAKRVSSKSGVKGVFPHGRGWMARIGLNRKIIHLGIFDTVEEAAKAYDAAATLFYGDFKHTEK